MKSITLKKLSLNDWNAYKSIRLELLQNNPTAFGSSFEEESAFSDEVWKTRLSKDHVDTIGAYHQPDLVGLCVLVRSPRSKMKHIGTIHSMYVRPDYRHQGIGEMLLEHAINEAKVHNIKRLNLSVVSTNRSAVSLYEKLGFIQYGVEPETIYYDNQYYDLILLSKII